MKALLLIIALSATAREHRFQKAVDPFSLQTEIKAAGIQVESISCFKTDCTVFMPNSEQGNPQPIIDAHVLPPDPKTVLASRLSQAKILARKARDTGLTSAEKDDLLVLLVRILLASDL
jgi:hypothetical protein